MDINVYISMNITLGMDKVVDFSILSQDVDNNLAQSLGDGKKVPLLELPEASK